MIIYSDLRECPFCGKLPVTMNTWMGNVVMCSNIECWINNKSTFPETWNNRAPLDTKDFIVVRRDVFEKRYISREAYNALNEAFEISKNEFKKEFIRVSNKHAGRARRAR